MTQRLNRELGIAHPLLDIFKVTGGNTPAEYEGHMMGLSVSLGGKTIWGCPVCQNRNIAIRPDYVNADATLSVDEAKYFPDRVGGGSYMIINEKMKNDLVGGGISGFIAHPIRVAYSPGCANPIRNKAIPPYFLMEITGRVDIDRQRFDNFEGSLCEGCRRWRPTPGSRYRWGEKTLLPLIETWNGGDFMLQGNIDSGATLCSRRVADLAAQKHWTGFGITVMSWGCRAGGNADLSDPNWFEDLSARVHEAYPIVDGIIKSPLDERGQQKQAGIAWPYPIPKE